MFVQIIEGRTSDAAGLMRMGERWEAELRPGATGFLGATIGVTADGRFINARPLRVRGRRPCQQRTPGAGRMVDRDGEALRRRGVVHRHHRHHRVARWRLQSGRLRPGDEVDRRGPGHDRTFRSADARLRRHPSRRDRRLPGLDGTRHVRRGRLLHVGEGRSRGREGRNARRHAGDDGRVRRYSRERPSTSTSAILS